MTDQPRDPFDIPAQAPRIEGTANPPMTLNDRGQWVIAIPQPGKWRFFQQCPGIPNQPCPRHFWTTENYRGHYALVHILGTP